MAKVAGGKSEEPTDEIIFKIVVVGPSESGKSALVRSMSHKEGGDHKKDNGELYPTVGVDFESKLIAINKPKKMELRLQLHDCGGRPAYAPTEDEFKSIFKSANAVVCCYDVRNHHSLEKVKDTWIPLVEKMTKPWASDSEEYRATAQFDPSCFFLVGNHVDQLAKDGEDPSNGEDKKKDDAVDLEEMDFELELDDDLDPTLANPSGFPSKGNPVTEQMVQDLTAVSELIKEGQTGKRLNAKSRDEAKQLNQLLCKHLLQSYKKRSDAQRAQKEKKKQEAAAKKAASEKEAREAAAQKKAEDEEKQRHVAGANVVADGDDADFSPRENDDNDADPLPATKEQKKNEGAKTKDRGNLDDKEDVPTVDPERKKKQPVKSDGCCAGGCTVS